RFSRDWSSDVCSSDLQGKVSPTQALVFACVICVLGMAVLIAFVNPLCAWLTLASFVGYAIIYTGWLKRATPQNIVIGGLSGAMRSEERRVGKGWRAGG